MTTKKKAPAAKAVSKIKQFNRGLDDNTIQMGKWQFQVSGEKAYVWHVDHPGEVHVTAKQQKFVVEAYTEDLENKMMDSEVFYVDLDVT